MFDRFREQYSSLKDSLTAQYTLAGDSRGISILNTVMTIAISGIALMVTLLVIGQVSGLVDNLDNSSAPIGGIIDGIYNAYQLAPVVFIVMFAGLIISVLLAWTGRSGTSRK